MKTNISVNCEKHLENSHPPAGRHNYPHYWLFSESQHLFQEEINVINHKGN